MCMYGSYALLSGRRGYVRKRLFGMVENPSEARSSLDDTREAGPYR